MDSRHFQFLLGTLKQSDDGRTAWLAFKEKTRWIDLSTADFTHRDLRGYDFAETNFSMAILREADLSAADFSDANVSCADLRRANLRGAILDRVRLDSANLQEANLSDVCLEGANLTHAKLVKAMLIGADLSDADLTGADLSGACLKYVRLTGARLRGADVSGADLTGAILDDDAPRQFAHFDKSRIDGRVYREMRCRTLDLDHEPHDEDSQARLVKVDGRHAPHHNLKLPGGAKLPPHALPGAGPAEGAHPHDGAHGRPRPAVPPPLRDAEPDLATVEGCCAVLEIPASASMDAIVKAFRAKAKLYHPDKVRHLSERMQELAAEEFRRLRRAYEALTRRTARPLTGVNWPEGMARYTSPYDYSPAEYEVLAGINPANTNILYNLAWKYFEDGRYNDARAWFERVLAINPGDQDAQYNIIIVRLYSELLLPEMPEK